MSIEPAPEHSEVQVQPISLPVPSGRLGLVYVIFILIMPGIAFWATDLFLPNWQDGKLDSYLILLLSPNASWIFFPLLVFSIVSYILIWVDYRWYSELPIVRLGIYTGLVLALQFSIVSALFFLKENPSAILALVLVWSAPLLWVKVYPWAVMRWGARNVIITLLVLFLLACIIVMAQGFIYAPIMLIVAALTLAAPFWSFLIFLRAMTWLIRNAEANITPLHGLGLTAWLGAYGVAWRISVLKMYELYASLPPQPPPDCYIATAAAQGHPQFVGSRSVLRVDGRSLKVNQQLQILKCAELALLAVSPRLQQAFRRLYDVVGTSLARRMQNPFLADIAYLLLKPWEWAAHLALWIIVPEIDAISKKMYM